MNDAAEVNAAPARIERLERYENRTAFPLVVAALLYIGIFTLQVLIVPMPTIPSVALAVVGYALWLTFAIDLVIRTVLAPNRLEYLARHPIDVVAVIVPAFRALRVLRVITAGQWLVRRGARLAVGRTALAIVVAVSMLAIIGALSVYDAERDASGASITSFGDAIWWAAVTMSTVGYGDLYPVTFQGRLVAVGMMVIGVGFLGLLSATLASGFLARLQGDQESEMQRVLSKLDRLEAQLAALSPDGPEEPEAHPRA